MATRSHGIYSFELSILKLEKILLKRRFSMEPKHSVGLSSTEIAGLWGTYISDSLSICLKSISYIIRTTQMLTL